MLSLLLQLDALKAAHPEAANAKRAQKEAKAKIKKPGNAFSTFVSEEYQSVSRDNPDLAAPQMLAKIAEKWKTIPEAEKKARKEKADKVLAKFNQDQEAKV